MLSNLLVVLGLLAALFRGEALRGWGFRPLVGHPSISFGWGKAARPLGRQLAPLLATNHAMGEWLEDAIYSGDIPGFLRRRAKDLLRDEFLSYVEDQIEVCADEDELSVLNEIADIIAKKLDLTDGMQDAGEVFEKRLDRILFQTPSKRRAYIEENVADMTLGFIDHVQGELKGMADVDSKVVMASVLQMIGQAKQTDLLGGDAAILEGADETLGQQFAKPRSSILEDGRSFDVSEKIGSGNSVAVGDAMEQLLGGLLFSSNDILEDVLNNLHNINDEFIVFLEKKVDASRDMEERTGLASLKETIQVVLDRVKEAEGEEGEVEEELTLEQVKQRMREVQMGKDIEEAKKGGGAVREEYRVQTDKKQTFKSVLRRFEGLEDRVAVTEAVVANYDLCDYDFMEMLRAEAQECAQQGFGGEAQQFLDLLDVINSVMAEKLGSAQDRLNLILGRGNPGAMSAEIGMMTRRGEVDEALVLLIEANIQQATAAGALPAAEVLKKLLQRVALERDRLQPEEQRLLRQLIKITVSEERKGLLYDAFRPQKVQDSQGDWVDGSPLITPPAFINMVQALIENFGNVETFDIMGKAQAIIGEAELVATDLYGAGMTPQQQQKFMFEKKTLSVWDLANFEEQALLSGEDVPWGNDKYNDMGPEDVLGERVKKVGGD